jgi:hypothetical protein
MGITAVHPITYAELEKLFDSLLPAAFKRRPTPLVDLESGYAHP